MSIKLTYFVHGTTTDNESGLATGWLPGKLSEIGQQQVVELEKLIADKPFDVVFSSDLKRAVDSALIMFGHEHEIIQDERLRECNYGDMNGALASEFKDRMEDYIDTTFPNGESYANVEQRINSFVEYLRKNYDGKRIAVVAHQAPQLALDVVLKGRTWQQSIDEDWRKTKAYQPGWNYVIV